MNKLSPPRLTTAGFPPDERNAITHIQGLLRTFEKQVQDFDGAIKLRDLCMAKIEVNKPNSGVQAPHYMNWLFMAAREGAITLDNFSYAIEGILESQKNAPTFCHKVHHKLITEANRTFDKAFPGFKKVRHVVTDSGELLKTPEDYHHDLNPSQAFPAADVRLIEHNKMTGTVFSTAINGRVVSYNLSSLSLEVLIEIKNQIFLAFLDAAK
jgi:hypothetical protein